MDTKDPKDRNEDSGEGRRENEDKERDDILNQLSETEGQKTPKKEPTEEPKREEAPPKPAPSGGGETEDIGSLIEERRTDQGQPQSPEVEGEPPVEDLSAFQRVVGIFTQPQRVFVYLRSKPDIWLPIIISIIVGIASSFLIYDVAITDTIASYEQNENIPDAQRDMIIDSIEQRRQGAWRYVSIFVFPVIGTFVIFALVALAFWFIGNVILGGKAKYKQVFSAFAYSYLIIAIAGAIVKIPLMLSKQTIKVHTSFAILMPQDASQSALFRFLDSFDIFTIWVLIVFSIGYAVIYRFSQTKAFMGVFISWLLYILIFSVALGSFIGRFTGQ